MDIAFEFQHHCPGNDLGNEPLVVCVIRNVKAGGIALRWQLKRHDASGKIRLGNGSSIAAHEFDVVDSHVCYYCGLDFDRVSSTIASILPSALELHRRGEVERAVATIMNSTNLPRADVDEILDAVLI